MAIIDMPSPKTTDRIKMKTDMKNPRRVTHDRGPFAFALTDGGTISGDLVALRFTPRRIVSIRVGGLMSSLLVTLTQRTAKVGIGSPLQAACQFLLPIRDHGRSTRTYSKMWATW